MANYAAMNPGLYRLGIRYSGPPFHHRRYIEELEPYKNVQFKTAVLHNRRIYVGNVRIEKQDGSIHTLADTMLRSEPGQFDKFTDRGRIDVAVGDGEDIIKLETYADRILEFKNRTLHIINASGKSEFLEDSYKFKGVPNPQSVARTDYGVAWANEFGCYLYDGREIHDLLEEGPTRKVKQSTWSSFMTVNALVGYSPTKRQIIVVDSYKEADSSGDIYLYDIPTKSWVQGFSRVSPRDKSNLTINPTSDNTSIDLVYVTEHAQTSTSATMEPWRDTPLSGTIDIRIRDEDFQEPHVRKKIHKVYVTSKNSNGVTLSAAVNGSENFSDITFDSNTLNTGSSWGKTTHRVTAGGNNIESVQLKLGGTASSDNFEINDISIVYRTKGIK